MRLLGGVVYRDRTRPAEPGLARAMAARAGGPRALVVTTAGPAMFFRAGETAPPAQGGGVLVAGDLELFDPPELRAVTGLTDAGSALGRLVERQGWDGTRHLRGAFSVARWDPAEETLSLAVDHLGIKRLYYAATPAAFAFSSRPSAVLAVPGVDGTPDPEAIYHYLNFAFVPAPWSAFRGVRRLPAGYELILRAGAHTVRRYWDIAYPEQLCREREACATTLALAREAVGKAMDPLPAKELGAYLSGGTDSSAIVGLMSQLSGERAHAFSIGFQEPRYDELGYAALSARHFGASHSTRIVTADDALRALPRLVQAFDEPLGNNSVIGTLFCAEQAVEAGAARLLAGDGGDEIFGGNERYRTDRIFGAYQRVPRLLRVVIEPLLRSLPEARGGLLRRAQRYVRRATMPNPRRFYSYEFFMAQEGRALVHPGFLAVVDPEAPWRLLEERFAEVRATSELNRLMYLDIKFTLGDNDLFKVTRTAEIAGVDVRFPFLHLPLLEFTATWPTRFKVRGLEKRYLFRRVFRDLLAAETLAKQKHGFGVPTSVWLKNHSGFRELVGDVLGSGRAKQRGYFTTAGTDELRARYATDATSYYGDIIWNVLMLELWHRHHVDRQPA